MKVTVTDENNQPARVYMGCYGIGISRVLAATVEEFHDDRGIIWPESIAPYDAHLVLLGKEEEVRRNADEIYDLLWEMGVETLYDDRMASAGEKLADADLIGIPHRLVVSKRSIEGGGVEWKKRSGEDSEIVAPDKLQEIFAPGTGEDMSGILGKLGLGG